MFAFVNHYLLCLFVGAIALAVCQSFSLPLLLTLNTRTVFICSVVRCPKTVRLCVECAECAEARAPEMLFLSSILAFPPQGTPLLRQQTNILLASLNCLAIASNTHPLFLFIFLPSQGTPLMRQQTNILLASRDAAAAAAAASASAAVIAAAASAPQPSPSPKLETLIREFVCRWCECSCDVYLCSLLCCSSGSASALVTFILCSAHAAHAILQSICNSVFTVLNIK
jgi:hypothetical protein